ncbi:hypothetical protein V2J09_000719 [Rumex salicifolius]
MAGSGVIRVLNVAEKPSVAKSVSGILSESRFRFRDGKSRYNKIYEFNYTIRGQQCEMLFTSVTGHLMETEFDDRYKKWHSCDPVQLYEAPIRKYVPEDKTDIKRTLEEEARRCQWLILWLDCDREGENISYEVVDVCNTTNSRLNIWRARFSALIDRDIHEAVQNLDRPNQNLSDAVDVRQEIDLRIGASFTRFQTMLLKDAFNFDCATDDKNLVISYGPCQFPTLGFVVERYWERESHEQEEFWSIKCSHKLDDRSAEFSWIRGRIFDYTCASIVYEMCIEEPTATVTKVLQQQKFKYPPYPLSTLELEKRASRWFRMSATETMKAAEDLYQTGFISYPRTETDSFSERTDLKAIVEGQQAHPVWGSYAERLLDSGTGLWRNPGNGGHDDKAHPPIHPTKFSSGESRWSEQQKNVYELVVRHFLACVSQPAIGAETSVKIDIAGEEFSASGRVIISRNYLDVYRFDSWGGSLIPTYSEGQQFTPTELNLASGFTQPPPLLSESDLLSAMDKAGIGTDATMHEHIKKLLDRFYAIKDESYHFSPTTLGEALVMGYDNMGYELWKPYLRSAMESDMKAVSMGTKRKEEALDACLQQMKACFLDARLNKEKLIEAMGVFFERSSRSSVDDQHVVGEVVRQCNLCQQCDMVLKRRPEGNFMVGCLGYPQCRNVVWLPGSLSEAVVTTNICSSCIPGPVYKIQFKFRRMEIPPNYNANHLGCIGGCDNILKQLIETCGTGSRIPGRERTSSTFSNNATNNARQACMHCRQTGHTSDNCPSLVSHTGRTRSSRMDTSNGEATVFCSSCQSPCIERTANTENNRGRRFYKCQSSSCNFFVWEDAVDNGGGGRAAAASTAGRRGGDSGRGRERGGGRNRATGTTFVSATGNPVSARACFICGDPAHFANACPNRGMQ